MTDKDPPSSVVLWETMFGWAEANSREMQAEIARGLHIRQRRAIYELKEVIDADEADRRFNEWAAKAHAEAQGEP